MSYTPSIGTDIRLHSPGGPGSDLAPALRSALGAIDPAGGVIDLRGLAAGVYNLASGILIAKPNVSIYSAPHVRIMKTADGPMFTISGPTNRSTHISGLFCDLNGGLFTGDGLHLVNGDEMHMHDCEFVNGHPTVGYGLNIDTDAGSRMMVERVRFGVYQGGFNDRNWGRCGIRIGNDVDSVNRQFALCSFDCWIAELGVSENVKFSECIGGGFVFTTRANKLVAVGNRLTPGNLGGVTINTLSGVFANNAIAGDLTVGGSTQNTTVNGNSLNNLIINAGTGGFFQTFDMRNYVSGNATEGVVRDLSGGANMVEQKQGVVLV